MADTFRKVAPGERLTIPARTYNAFVDAARDYQGRQMGQEQGSTPGGKNAGTILVRNDSGADRERFDVLGIDSPVFTPDDDEDAFKNQVAFAGVVPTLKNHAGKFVILLEPVVTGEIGRACIVGVCPVLLDVGDEKHAFADVSDNDASVLKSGTDGSAQIVWKEDGTGQVWGVVRMGNPATGIRWGVLTEDWDADTCPNFVTVNPCDRDGGNPDSETEVKVYLGWPDSTKIAPYFYALKSDSIIPYLPLGQADDGTLEGTALRLWTTSVWGRVTADWQDGNNFVMVRLCDEDGSEIGYSPDVKCWLFSPESLSDIKGVKLSAGDLIRVELPTFDRGSGVTIAHAINAYSGSSANKLLDGKNHTDTTETDPTKGDLIYSSGDPVKWTRLSVGDKNAVMVVDSGLPYWMPPVVGVLTYDAIGTGWLPSTDNAGAILINDKTPEPIWLSAGTAGYVLTMDDGLPTWKEPVGSITAGTDQSILFTEADSLAWLSKLDTDGGILTTVDGALTWLPPTQDGNSQVIPGGILTNLPSGKLNWVPPLIDPDPSGTYMDGTPLRFNNSTHSPEWFNGPTATLTFVTDLQSDGITWQKKSRQIDVAKGVVTRIGDETDWETYYSDC